MEEEEEEEEEEEQEEEQEEEEHAVSYQRHRFSHIPNSNMPRQHTMKKSTNCGLSVQ